MILGQPLIFGLRLSRAKRRDRDADRSRQRATRNSTGDETLIADAEIAIDGPMLRTVEPLPHRVHIFLSRRVAASHLADQVVLIVIFTAIDVESAVRIHYAAGYKQGRRGQNEVEDRTHGGMLPGKRKRRQIAESGCGKMECGT